ncbi:hypothetical protein [Streptomyces glomeratus]|uniref:Uncharacterized protein n=1 Tax=Streptomyces glomeratus TaxID=284452 RepID=A0ABP6LR50_9ACTN|nr:hypothetical protein [Streptomyces glomeratus]MCF1507668.1 hypothetical protein [Streptomyces glomeratus]
MTEDARPGLIRVVYFEQTSALMMGAGAVLSEGLLLALISTADRLETLLVGTVAVTLVCLALLPLGFRLPARLRRRYEHAAQMDGLDTPHADQDAARRQSLRRTAVSVSAAACWMVLIGLTFHELMPPVMLVPVAMVQWARSRATTNWERANGAALWQGAPGVLGTRGPVFRVPADYGM